MQPEFSLIQNFLKSVGNAQVYSPEIIIPAGDDAAVLGETEGSLVVSIDTVVEGVHFSHDFYQPADIGVKATEAALSDIVAMGARPRWVLVSIALNQELADDISVAIFKGVGEALLRNNCHLLGGDTTSSPGSLVITVTAIGVLNEPESLCPRSGAHPGQTIYLSGPTGLSQAGFLAMTEGYDGFEDLISRHRRPRARTDIDEDCFRAATAMIDISDGLASELHHLAEASDCRFNITESLLPVVDDLKALAIRAEVNPLDLVLGGGEDYELLFTADSEYNPQDGFYRIGETVVGAGVYIQPEYGQCWQKVERAGYEHFST